MFGMFNKEELEIPKIGSKWILSGEDGSPWANKSISSKPLITVLDVKDKWVRYKIGNGNIFGDERLELECFLRLYREIKNNN